MWWRGRPADLLEVVVLAGDAQAALVVDRPVVAARLGAGEDVLELDHARVREQERLVAGRAPGWRWARPSWPRSAKNSTKRRADLGRGQRPGSGDQREPDGVTVGSWYRTGEVPAAGAVGDPAQGRCRERPAAPPQGRAGDHRTDDQPRSSGRARSGSRRAPPGPPEDPRLTSPRRDRPPGSSQPPSFAGRGWPRSPRSRSRPRPRPMRSAAGSRRSRRRSIPDAPPSASPAQAPRHGGDDEDSGSRPPAVAAHERRTARRGRSRRGRPGAARVRSQHGLRISRGHALITAARSARRRGTTSPSYSTARLARRDGPDGRVRLDRPAAAAGRLVRRAGADPAGTSGARWRIRTLGPERRRRRPSRPAVAGHERGPLERDASRLEVLAPAEAIVLVRRVDPGDVARLAERHAQALALADRVAGRSRRARRAAARRRRRAGPAPAPSRPAPAARRGSRRRARSRSPGSPACRRSRGRAPRAIARTSGLVSSPSGKRAVPQLVLAQAVQEVGLVLASSVGQRRSTRPGPSGVSTARRRA